jgi:hypothetical protein
MPCHARADKAISAPVTRKRPRRRDSRPMHVDHLRVTVKALSRPRTAEGDKGLACCSASSVLPCRYVCLKKIELHKHFSHDERACHFDSSPPEPWLGL